MVFTVHNFLQTNRKIFTHEVSRISIFSSQCFSRRLQSPNNLVISRWVLHKKLRVEPNTEARPDVETIIDPILV